jgi:hypothetical protein
VLSGWRRHWGGGAGETKGVEVNVGVVVSLEDMVLALDNKEFRSWKDDTIFWHGGADGWGLHGELGKRAPWLRLETADWSGLWKYESAFRRSSFVLNGWLMDELTRIMERDARAALLDTDIELVE